MSMEAEPKKDAQQIISETITDIEKMMAGDFRISYFPILFSSCQRLLLYMEDKQSRKNLLVELETIKEKVNKQKGDEAPIAEDLISETENFTRELIEKIKNEQNKN